jgi:heme A synthase
MFLSAVLFVLFMAGCWLYCLADAALTPAAEFTGLRKHTWIAVIAVTFTVGAAAWMLTRSARLARARSHAKDARQATAATGTARERHPASQARKQPRRIVPIGPDDDPEFLRMLDRLISGTPDPGE